MAFSCFIFCNLSVTKMVMSVGMLTEQCHIVLCEIYLGML
jgi:hypothetical protein